MLNGVDIGLESQVELRSAVASVLDQGGAGVQKGTGGTVGAGLGWQVGRPTTPGLVDAEPQSSQSQALLHPFIENPALATSSVLIF